MEALESLNALTARIKKTRPFNQLVHAGRLWQEHEQDAPLMQLPFSKSLSVARAGASILPRG